MMQFGYAETEISPRDGMSTMSGYGRRRYAQGTTTPLLLQAAVIRDRAGRRHAVVAADILGFDRFSTLRVRRALAPDGFAPQRVMLNASHTHFGPPTQYGILPSVGPVDPWYVFWLEDQVVATVRRAVADLGDAQVRYGSFEIKLGDNRRLPQEGKMQMVANPDGDYDPHTCFLWAKPATAGRPDVLLVAHGCHPVRCPAPGYSPDFPGEFRRHVQSHCGGVRPIFLQGCGADINEPPGDGYIRIGEQLAGTALSQLDPARLPLLEGTFSCAIAEAQLPLGRRLPQRRLLAQAVAVTPNWQTDYARVHLHVPDRRRSISYAVQAWRCADFSLVGLQGEVVSAYGPLTRTIAGGECMVLGYTNAVECYIPTTRILREGGYEAVESAFAYGLPAPLSRAAPRAVQGAIRQALARTAAGVRRQRR